MSARPEVLAKIDRYFAAARIAHEVIADLHGELVAAGQDDAHTRELLHDAARVAVIEMPAVAREAHRLDRRWQAEDLLDQPAAARTLRALETTVNAIEPALAQLRARQNEIAAELRRLLEG